jgi:dTDP-4-amino-4,6-dideoxygalactose transaminase
MAAAEVLSLPMYPELTAENQQRVIAALSAFAQAPAGDNRELSPV